jgi:hypothetical protein
MPSPAYLIVRCLAQRGPEPRTALTQRRFPPARFLHIRFSRGRRVGLILGRGLKEPTPTFEDRALVKLVPLSSATLDRQDRRQWIEVERGVHLDLRFGNSRFLQPPPKAWIRLALATSRFWWMVSAFSASVNAVCSAGRASSPGAARAGSFARCLIRRVWRGGRQRNADGRSAGADLPITGSGRDRDR